MTAVNLFFISRLPESIPLLWALGDFNLLNADKLGVNRRLTAVFDEHCDYFFQVFVQFIQGFALGVRTRKAGHIPDVQSGLLAAFDDSRKPHFASPFALNVSDPVGILALSKIFVRLSQKHDGRCRHVQHVRHKMIRHGCRGCALTVTA
jgi:hypothetical protein